jgi:uncharacterized membrane protein YqjE
MAEPVAGVGLLGSLRRLAASAAELAQTRLELLGCELEQAKLRLFDALLWAAVALLLLGVGLVGLVAFVLLLMQENYRLTALAVLVLLFVVGGVGLMLLARRRLQSPDGLFASSAAELARDRADLGAGG